MTTWDIAPSGGDYTTSSAWASNASTVASDIGEISGDWTSATDTATVTLADNSLIYRTKVGDQARHAGFDNGGTNHELAVTSGHCIQVNNTGCTIDGLLVTLNNATASNEGTRNAAAALTVINSIYRAANAATTQQDGIYTGDLDATVNAENVMVMKFGRGGFHAQMFSGTTRAQTWNIISGTFWDNGDDGSAASNGGVRAQTAAAASTFQGNIHNTISVESQDADFTNSSISQLGTNTWDIHNTVASDTSPTDRDAGAVNANESVTVVEGNPTSGQLGLRDITSAPFDLRLFDDSADNVAQDEHATASGAGLTFGDYTSGDIAGTSRPQDTNYDIGAFEVAVAGAGGPRGPFGQPLHGPFGGPIG